MTKRALKVLLAAMLIAATFVGVAPIHSPIVGAQTGGQIIPCPGSPWGNGWFNNFDGSVNCTQQNNHIVVDAYDNTGARTQAVLDIWYGNNCDTVQFVQPTSTLEAFRVVMVNNNVQDSSYPYGCGMHGVPVWTSYYPTMWRQDYQVGVDPYWTPQTINQCYLTSTKACSSLSGGSSTARPNGINNGPHYRIVFVGAGLATYAPGSFSTSIWFKRF